MADEQFVDLRFPRNGTDVSTAFSEQRPGTTPLGVNVRAFDPSTSRARGGSRPGLAKYHPDRPDGATGLIQELVCVVGVFDPPGGGAGS